MRTPLIVLQALASFRQRHGDAAALLAMENEVAGLTAQDEVRVDLGYGYVGIATLYIEGWHGVLRDDADALVETFPHKALLADLCMDMRDFVRSQRHVEIEEG